jgi:hypothetical protein
MDLGAAAEGIGMAHRAGWLLCIAAIHLPALCLCWADPVRRGRRPPVLPFFALALVVGCHAVLLLTGTWHYLVVEPSSLGFRLAIAAAEGWIVYSASRALLARRSFTFVARAWRRR